MPFVNAFEEKILNRIFRTDPGSIRPSALWVALLTTLPDAAGAGSAEVAGLAGRVQVTQADADWTDPTAGTQGEVENVDVIDFGDFAGDTERAIGVAVFDDETAGTMKLFSALATGWLYFAGKASTEVLTCAGHGLADDDRVFVRGQGLASGLDAKVEYYVVGVSGDTFQLSLTSGGSAVNVSADGGGQFAKSRAQDLQDGNPVTIPANALKWLLGG